MPPPALDSGDHEDSISGLFSRLIHDVEAFVRAEVRLYRAQVFSRLGDVKIGLIFGITALVLAQATLVAGLVGLVLVLQNYIGAGWATIAVVGGTLLVAGLLGWLALRGFRKAFAGDPK